MSCEYCGGPLCCFEGEWYCPNCTRYEVEKLAEQALDEALLHRASEVAAPTADDGATDDGPPF
jgi:uncharacterized Zn finger protein (UPF0148 family)